VAKYNRQHDHERLRGNKKKAATRVGTTETCTEVKLARVVAARHPRDATAQSMFAFTKSHVHWRDVMLIQTRRAVYFA
jgi:hypothetical protein